MAADKVVRARIDGGLKSEATAVLASMGLTTSDAFRMLLVRVVKERALPFQPWTPNETTIAAMREARAITTPRFNSVQDLMADLHAED